MTNPYPLPRDIRETPILFGDGRATYGPFNFRIWDAADITAVVSRNGGPFTPEPVSATKTTTAPFEFFIATFATPLSAGDRAIVRSTRLHERQSDVTRGGTIVGQNLERELAVQTTTIQELRRDTNQSVHVQPGHTGSTMLPPYKAGQVLVWSDTEEALATAPIEPGAIEAAIERTEALRAQAKVLAEAAYDAVAQVAVSVPYPLPTVSGGAIDPERALPLAYSRASADSRINGSGFIHELGADTAAHEYDPFTGEYLGVRFQPASSDFGLYSENIGNGYWIKYRGAIQASTVAAPSGIGTAEFFAEDTQNGVHGFGRGSIPFTAGEHVLFATFVKSADFTIYHAAFEWVAGSNTVAVWNVVTGVTRVTANSGGSAGIVPYPEGWFLLWASAPAPGNSSGRIYFGSVANGLDVYPGVSGRGFWCWGARLARRRAIDSYVKSEASSGVRAVANANGPAVFAPYGSVLVEGRCNALPVGANARIASFYANGSNRVHLTVTPEGALHAAMVLNGSTVFTSGPTIRAGQKFRAVVGWDAGRQYLAGDGVLYPASAPVNQRLSGQGSLSLAQTATSGGDQVGDVSITEARLFARALGDEAARVMTAPRTTIFKIASRAYLEAGHDLATDVIMTWHGEADFPPFAEYRTVGAVAWQSVPATIRDFPFSSEKVFSAFVTGLSPNTTYEWRTGGSGAADIRRFRTASGGRALRVDFVSDWQTGSALPTVATSMWNRLNNLVGAGSPDVILIGGDLAQDDGATSAAMTQRWTGFINAWASRFKRPDGTMIPIAVIAGNHEAGPGTPGPGSFTGNQPYGYIDRLFTTFYRSAVNVGGKGYGFFSIGSELLVVGLETHHGTPLDDVQIGWLESTLEIHAASFRHVLVMGHFSPGSFDNGHWTALYAGPVLRERVFPVLQKYPNVKFYIHGHNHVLQSTRKVRWTPNNPPTGRNLWFEHAKGIRLLGAGGWDSGAAVGYNVQDQASEIDGSVLVEKLVATNLPPRGVTPISPPNNTGADPATRHFWRMTFSQSTARAEAISVNGSALIDIVEPLGG